MERRGGKESTQLWGERGETVEVLAILTKADAAAWLKRAGER
jgi:hypothetical protein